MPTISIIVPVYNVEKYVLQCLNSIAAQTFSNFECLVIDDGSNDNSGKICDEFASNDSRFQVIHQTNLGLSASRNKGLDLAQGEFVCFIDSDDYIAPRYCELLLKTIEEANSSIALIKCRSVAQDENQEKEEIQDYPCTDFVPRDRLIKYSFNNQLSPNLYAGYAWNKLYRSSFISHERFINTTCEDLEFNLRFYKRTEKLPVVNAIGYYYRQHDESITCRDPIAFRLKAIPDQFDYYNQYLSDEENSLKADILWFLFRKLCTLRLFSIKTDHENDVRNLSQLLYKQNIKEIKALLHWTKRRYILFAINCPFVHKVALNLHIIIAKYR